MSFTKEQVKQLLRPIRPERVLRDGQGHSHVSQQDITAHLIRVFGFGSFDTKLMRLDCLFEEPHVKEGKPVLGRWDVCYLATMQLTVKDEHGRVVCSFEDGSTATAQNQNHGDAHDLAMKSAISLAKKRAAINLGDQFGLSLYNKGQMSSLVKGTLITGDDAHDADGEDVQEGVEQQVAIGNDEIEREEPPEERVTPATPRQIRLVRDKRDALNSAQAAAFSTACREQHLPNLEELNAVEVAIALSVIEAITEQHHLTQEELPA